MPFGGFGIRAISRNAAIHCRSCELYLIRRYVELFAPSEQTTLPSDVLSRRNNYFHYA